MKILSITEFVTTEGVNAETEIPLSGKSGVFYRIMTDAFTTPYFTAGNTFIPVNMLHSDRSPGSVNVTIAENKVTLTQGYRMVSRGFLMEIANNDWVDEESAVLVNAGVDTLNIDSVVMNSGASVSVTASISGEGVTLKTTGFTPTSSTYYSQNVKTTDEKVYVYPIKWTAHQASTDPVSYDYMTTTIPRVITAYWKG